MYLLNAHVDDILRRTTRSFDFQKKKRVCDLVNLLTEKQNDHVRC